jgi:c-di-GMP-binding flagellar brake protein YcgR
MTAENRRHPRYAVEVGAELTLGPQTLSAATQNVSEGGVGLVLDEPLEEGTNVGLTLFLTQDGIEDPDEEPFETSATIAWTAPSDAGGQVAGARFGALSEGQRAQLRRFLAALAE